ncbi:hypothetical protein [Nonomuraea sp. NPDC050310]|uniref:hypothetical protein n=1 Tax=Nonomuraea sp. NPDC050310 TaxID=3154935 RepID=UPI0033C8D065
MSLIIGDRIRSLRVYDRKVAAGEIKGFGHLQGHNVAYVQWDELKYVRDGNKLVRWLDTVILGPPAGEGRTS